MRVLLAMLMCVMPAWAVEQTAQAALPDHDTTISIGWTGAEHETRDQRRWHGSLLAGVNVGHYWTDHLKTEAEASWSSPRTHQIYENFERDGGYTYALSDYRAYDIRIGVAQLYQFGRNEWVHPYVGVGADVVRRASSFERLPQSRTIFVQNRNIPVAIPAASERTTGVFAQAILKAGVKMYVSEKAFFNTELKLGVRDDVDHVVWKFGMGVDF
ncbi:MAG: outer membrane beta-barrel protein [Vicinamibacterales bacterium]